MLPIWAKLKQILSEMSIYQKVLKAGLSFSFFIHYETKKNKTFNGKKKSTNEGSQSP